MNPIRPQIPARSNAMSRFLGLSLTWASMACASTNDWYGIRVVDEAAGRGVPLVELETVNHLRFVTDNAGWVALGEPGWAGRDVFLHVRSHGYTLPKDGFGYTGLRVRPTPGGRTMLRLQRLNVAERLYRVTGEGLYRDSVLLGEPTPLAEPLGSALVVGQDSAQVGVYRGRLHWFWGDTARMGYPLGQFRTAGAVSDLPGHGGLDPKVGVNLRYWTNADGLSREMCPLDPKEEGLVWIDGLAVVPDAAGRERMVAHYSRMKSLGERLEHGLAVWSDDLAVFERCLVLATNETWRFVVAHPTRHRTADGDFLFCGENLPNVRVPARLDDVLDPTRYEAWTCLATDRDARDQPRPRRNAAGGLDYSWSRDTGPVRNTDEERWLKAGLVTTNELRLLPADVESGRRVRLHGGSTRWNVHRQRWVAIMVEVGGTSFLGEVWYAEAAGPTGPWRRARRILTHDRYSFYNPVHHDFFDAGSGRFIFFEGTYANTFSGNPDATPRYDYNQVMYRLDLDDSRLAAVRE
jgi:hypothetical protein